MSPGDRVRWLNARQQGSWRAFIMGTELLLHQLDRDLRDDHELSLNEYEVLVRLSEQPSGRMRMATLADAMCHSRSRVTHTVARMQRAGLVERAAADDDGRGVEAVMTDLGRRVLVEAAPTHVRGVRDNLIDLASAEDIDALGRIFNAVSDRLLADHADEADIRRGQT